MREVQGGIYPCTPAHPRAYAREGFQMTKKCKDCGKEFQPKFDSAKRCTKCWVEERESVIRQDARERGYRAGWDQGNQAGYNQGLRKAPKETSISDSFLLDLLKLCHPDHQPLERLGLATRVTQEINAMREQRKVRR